MNGPGTWVLSANNTYNGTTTVSGGTLALTSGTLAGGGATNVNGGVLSVNANGSLAGSGQTSVNGGVLSLNNGSITGGNVTVGAAGTLSGFGTISVPTVVNGVISPSLTRPLNFNRAGNLTMNNGSTFVLTGSGGAVGQAEKRGQFRDPLRNRDP